LKKTLGWTYAFGGGRNRSRAKLSARGGVVDEVGQFVRVALEVVQLVEVALVGDVLVAVGQQGPPDVLPVVAVRLDHEIASPVGRLAAADGQQAPPVGRAPEGRPGGVQERRGDVDQAHQLPAGL